MDTPSDSLRLIVSMDSHAAKCISSDVCMPVMVDVKRVRGDGEEGIGTVGWSEGAG